MKIIEPSVRLEDKIDGTKIIKKIERIGRVCYKSENNITEDSAERFIQNIIKSGHESVLEHVSISVRVICDRGVTHEIVRHRVASYSQESTRYCNYSNEKFGNELTFIKPCWIDDTSLQKIKGSVIAKDEYGSLILEYYYHLTVKEESWFKPWEITPESNFIASLQVAEQLYLELLNQGWTPQQARAVLPNSLKTELVMTGVISDWKHFFELRCDNKAHPQARELAIPLREEFIKTNLI